MILSKLPLLQKELTTYASKKRLYVIRVVYGLALYTIFLYSWSDMTKIHKNFDLLGKGKIMMHTICVINVLGILCLVPGMCATAITREKERKTLALLLVCPLHRSQILFEKYVVIFFLMLSLLVISVPIISLSYLLGGITSSGILLCLYSQILTLVQVIAIGAFCSCYFRSSVTSTITAYMVSFFLYFFLPLMLQFSFSPPNYLISPYLYFRDTTTTNLYLATAINWAFSITLILAAAKIFLLAEARSIHQRVKKTTKNKALPSKLSTLVNLGQQTITEKYAYFRRHKNVYFAGFCLVIIFVVASITIIVLERHRNIVKGNLFDVYAMIFLVMFGVCLILLLKIPNLRTPVLWLERRTGSLPLNAKILLGTVLLCIVISDIFISRSAPFYIFLIWMALLTVVVKSAYLFHRDIIKERWLVLRTTPLSIGEIWWQKTAYITRYTLVCAFTMSILLPFYYSNCPQYSNRVSYILVLANAWGHYFLWTFISFVLWQFMAMALSSFFKKAMYIGFTCAMLLFLSLTPVGPVGLLDFLYTSSIFPYNYDRTWNPYYSVFFENKGTTFLYSVFLILLFSGVSLWNTYRKNR